MLTTVETWLEVATTDGFDAEAVTFVRDFITMLRERVEAMRIEDQSNGEIYRMLHVEKNIIQREILNPSATKFTFPIAPVEP